MADKYFLDWTEAGKMFRKPATSYTDLSQILKDAYNDYIKGMSRDVLRNRGIVLDSNRLLARPGKTVSNRVPVPYKNNQVMNIVQPGEAKRNAAKARLEAASRLPNDGEVIYGRTTKQTPRLTTAKTTGQIPRIGTTKQSVPLLTTSGKSIPNVGKNAETIDMLFGNPKNKFSDLEGVTQAASKNKILNLANNPAVNKALKVAGPVLGIAGGYGQLRNAQNYGQDDLTRGFMKANGLLDMAVGSAPIAGGAANLISKIPFVGTRMAAPISGYAGFAGHPVVQGTAALLGGYATGRPVERFLNKYIPNYRNAMNEAVHRGVASTVNPLLGNAMYDYMKPYINQVEGNMYNTISRNDIGRKILDFLANEEPNKISAQNNTTNNNNNIAEETSEQPNGNEQPKSEAQQNMDSLPYIPYNATPEQVAQILGDGEGVVGPVGEMINQRTANGQGYQGDAQNIEGAQDTTVPSDVTAYATQGLQNTNQANGNVDIMALLDKMYNDTSNRNITPENLALARLAGGYRRNPYYAQLMDKSIGSRAAEAAKAKIITEYMKEAQADKAVEGRAAMLTAMGINPTTARQMAYAEKAFGPYVNYIGRGETNANRLLIEDKKQLGSTNRNYLDNYTRLQIALENNKYKLSPRDQMLIRGYVAAATNNPEQALYYYSQMNPEAREVLEQSVEEAGLGERKVEGKAAPMSAYQ